jgi:hypothetical protein
MKIEGKVLLGLLIGEGWHISDGVDSCSGHDDEGMAESANDIAARLTELGTGKDSRQG